MMDGLVEAGKEYGMNIDTTKTNAIRIARTTCRRVKITIHGEMLKQVKEFCYLESKFIEDGMSEEEIRCRNGMAK